MSERNEDRPKLNEWGQSWEIAAALWDGPRTLPEIVDHFYSYIRLLGLFRITRRMERRHGKMAERIEENVEALIGRGWVARDGDRYALTELGRQEARKPIAEMRRTGKVLRRLTRPEAVSQVGLALHLGLAALKLPAALLSGSVGLLNDATDTLLDGLSSVLVYLGLRFDRERAVNGVLVVLMLGTGGFTFYEAVRRFFVPFEPDVDAFTFAATVVSALVCWGLYLYQRFVGVRSGSVALVTQSVDSRNHVIVAVSVTAGLVAARVDFPLLDTVVGLGVAVLILKSAVELTIETVRSMGDERVDLSRYEMGLAGWYEQFRQAQLRDWMLHLAEVEGVRTWDGVLVETRRALDFSDHPMLRALGVDRSPLSEEALERAFGTLLERGWLIDGDPLTVTEAGRGRLLAVGKRKRERLITNDANGRMARRQGLS